MYSLLIANIPYDCKEDELREWIQAKGVGIRHVRLICDLVSGTSPSFAQVQLNNPAGADLAAVVLNGQRLRNRTLRAKALNLIDTSGPVRRMKATA